MQIFTNEVCKSLVAVLLKKICSLEMWILGVSLYIKSRVDSRIRRHFTYSRKMGGDGGVDLNMIHNLIWWRLLIYIQSPIHVV